ncbi:MAG: non-ribosomal peptide synthetase, partial [Gammaproteobacteria bacterium]|nr:non-ribosomal peptide synthetase [Gammaproteobacteria bacterium]
IDLQIQVRGVRVELGEIEAQLIQLEGVNKAVVSLISQVPGENLQQEGLVAYLHTDNDIDSQELRRRLAVKLPEAMVPKIFQAVESLPVTANGKIDRKNLPPIVLPDAADTYVGPETQTEEKLVGIWQQVLGLDKISTRDDFFALGGHSLLATKVHNRLRDTFMLEIPLRTLFEVTTIKELAGVVQALTTPSDEGGEAMSDMDEGGFDEGSF